MNNPRHETIEQQSGELALISSHEKHEAVVLCKKLRDNADDVVDRSFSYHVKGQNQGVVCKDEDHDEQSFIFLLLEREHNVETDRHDEDDDHVEN